MKWLKLYSLQSRLIVLLLLPITLILVGAGAYGFSYARKTILSQWNEAAILKLERAAHQIDMRLAKPIELLNLYFKSGASLKGRANQQWILQQLEALDGVTDVQINPHIESAKVRPHAGHGGKTMPMHHDMQFTRGVISDTISPVYSPDEESETVQLISYLLDDHERKVGDIQVDIKFEYLLSGIGQSGWWQSDMACLIDKSGAYLVHTNDVMGRRRLLGETGDPLELDILARIKAQNYATVRGPGSPPSMVAGFYSLKQAPWAILIFAPGEKILRPMVRFRNGFVGGALVIVIVVVILIRLHVGKMVRSVKKISNSAHKVARGEYGPPITAETEDEIGDLIVSHNAMVLGLKERDQIRNTFGRYIDPDFAKTLLSRPEAAQLGGQIREVVILMSDIREFTPMVDAIRPETTLSIINQYLTHMIDVIHRHKGIIVDFVGDAILVFFEPIDESLEALNLRAVTCAMEMHKDMKNLKEELRFQGHPVFEMGIGVHCGQVVVGIIGSKTRAKYGIVGPPVNLTQRIQDQADGGEVVITDTVLRHVNNKIQTTRSFEVKLKGVAEPVRLHVVLQQTDSGLM